MKFLASLQQHLGFTHNEIRVVLFLSATFLVGLGIRWFDAAREKQVTTQFDYTQEDSEYVARTQALASLAPTSSSSIASPAASSPHRKPSLKEKSINLNTANAAQLIQLPGIGPSYAERIIAYRTEHGRFKKVEELENVKGIGKKRLEQIRPFVVVEQETQEARDTRQER